VPHFPVAYIGFEHISFRRLGGRRRRNADRFQLDGRSSPVANSPALENVPAPKELAAQFARRADGFQGSRKPLAALRVPRSRHRIEWQPLPIANAYNIAEGSLRCRPMIPDAARTQPPYMWRRISDSSIKTAHRVCSVRKALGAKPTLDRLRSSLRLSDKRATLRCPFLPHRSWH